MLKEWFTSLCALVFTYGASELSSIAIARADIDSPSRQVGSAAAGGASTERIGGASATSEFPVPANLFLPPNPSPPNVEKARQLHLEHLLAQRTTNYFHATPSQAKNIELVISRLDGVVIRPGATFSYNKNGGPYTEENGYGWGRAFSGDRIIPSLGGGVCQGASTLYSTVIRTGLLVVERHQHGLTVPYLPPGEDATVSYTSGLDFKFRNNLATPVLITAKAYPNRRVLTVALWGAKPGPEIQVRHKILAIYPYRTIYKSSGSAGTKEHVLFPGQKGVKVMTWLEVKTPNGVIRKPLGTDNYRPSPRIVEKK